MPITSQQIIEDDAQTDGRRHLRYEFTDHLGKKHLSGLKKALPAFNANADLIIQIPAMEDFLATQEVIDAINKAENLINPDKVSEHQAQEDFDRRVLGRMMLIIDAHVFHAAYPMFKAVEIRSGTNPNARAAKLGITRGEYDLIASRFNSVHPLEWFLNDEKNMVWDELPDVFE